VLPLIRTVTYAAVFIGFFLVFLPARLLERSGVIRPAVIGVVEIAAATVTVLGAALALWCVLTFALVGRGTPAPFDPPRRLIRSGPYGLVRNPMYIGAGLALAGAALFYRSLPLLGYTVGFFLITHVFVLVYEEPTLKRLFGDEYHEYLKRVQRWWPTTTRQQR